MKNNKLAREERSNEGWRLRKWIKYQVYFLLQEKRNQPAGIMKWHVLWHENSTFNQKFNIAYVKCTFFYKKKKRRNQPAGIMKWFYLLYKNSRTFDPYILSKITGTGTKVTGFIVKILTLHLTIEFFCQSTSNHPNSSVTKVSEKSLSMKILQ